MSLTFSLATEDVEAVADEVADEPEDEDDADAEESFDEVKFKLDFTFAESVVIFIIFIFIENLVGAASTSAPLSRVTLTVRVLSAVTIDLSTVRVNVLSEFYSIFANLDF